MGRPRIDRQKSLFFKASGLLSSGRPAPISNAIVLPNATEHMNNGEYSDKSRSGTVSSIKRGPTIENIPHPTPYMSLPLNIDVMLSTRENELPINPRTDASMKVFFLPILRI
jgi:hypothetical protein